MYVPPWGCGYLLPPSLQDLREQLRDAEDQARGDEEAKDREIRVCREITIIVQSYVRVALGDL